MYKILCLPTATQNAESEEMIRRLEEEKRTELD